MKATKRVSIVMPTYDNFEMLAATITALLPTISYEDELIFIDNGSSDGTSKYLASMQEQTPDGFVTIVTNAENEGFCTATNQGMAKAKGKFICWLNDDVVVYPHWVEKLTAMMDGSVEHPFHPNVSLVGPMSNYVGGSQMVQLTDESMKQLNPESGLRLDNELGEKSATVMPPLENWLSGFCLMLKREVYETIGGIDEVYSPGGCCDSDFVLRATTAGFGAAISPICFVWHYGSVTLNKVAPEGAAGTGNWHTFFGKFKGDPSVQKKLVMFQRIQISTEENLALYERCLKRNLELVDGVIIIDDKSALLNEDMVKAWCGDKLVRYLRNPDDAPMSEARDRLIGQQSCGDVKDEFAWACCFDHDECFAADVTRERLQRLMNPVCPNVWGYKMLFNNYWRSEDLVRTDGNWGHMITVMMWKNDPVAIPNTLRPQMYEGDTGLHCGRSPQGLPEASIRMCSLVVDHYGYTSIAQNQAKKDFYEEHDKSPDWIKKRLVGLNGYDHLTNERGLQLAPVHGTTISANVMVKNEENHLGHLLTHMGEFFDELIICDTGSVDNTLGYLNEAGVPYIEKKMEDDFSDIRNHMIDLSKSEYIFHLDADETPINDSLLSIVLAMRRGCDIQPVQLHSVQKNGDDAPTEQPRLFKNNGIFRYDGRVHETLEHSLNEFEQTVPRPPQQGEEDIHFMNKGYLRDDSRIDVKLNYYAKLLRMEIEDNPDNHKGFCELAAHERNISNYDECERLLLKCIEIDDSYLPAYRDLAMLHAKRAFDVIASSAGKDFFQKEVVEQLQRLHQMFSPLAAQPGVGTEEHRRGEQPESYKTATKND